MTENAGQRVATIDGMLLCGRTAKGFVPQSGIRAICYPSREPDCATRANEDPRCPLVPLASADGTIGEPALVEQAWDIVRRNTTPTAHLEDGGCNRKCDREPVKKIVASGMGC